MKPLLLVCIIVAILFINSSCRKGGDQSAQKADSVRLLTSIETGRGMLSEAINFEYDGSHLLQKISWPHSLRSKWPFLVYYKNGRVSSVVSQMDSTKSSMIILYGPSSRCTKVVYKNSVVGMDNNSPYFVDVTDGKWYGYDTLIYNTNSQLIQIDRYNNASSGYQKASAIGFYYPTLTDTVVNKITREDFDLTGNSTKFEKMTVTTNNIDNPASKLVWYFPFLHQLSYILGGESNAVSLRLLFDGSSDYTSRFLPLIPKCVTSCQMSSGRDNTVFGSIIFTSATFDYSYSADSSQFQSTTRGPLNGGLHMDYYFSKVKK